MKIAPPWAAVGLLCILFVTGNPGYADPVVARFKQGSGHAFLTLRGEDGRILAVGETLDSVRGSIVTSRLTFRFRDGSIDDDTTVYEQGHDLHLLSDHHIQQGPSFPHPLDTRIDAAISAVTVRDLKSGKETIEHLDLPADLANGLVTQLIKNIVSGSSQLTVSYLAAGSKPKLIKLVISAAGLDSFSIAGTHHHARKYEIKVGLGGAAALVAPVLGKQPKNVYVWLTGNRIPALLKTQAQFYEGGPLWTVQQASPVWTASSDVLP